MDGACAATDVPRCSGEIPIPNARSPHAGVRAHRIPPRLALDSPPPFSYHLLIGVQE